MNFKEIIGAAVLIIFFLAGALVAHEFSDELARYLDFGILGMGVYVLAGITATVVAPISTVPLIPIASALWGPFLTGILNILAWFIGSVIAFIIARRLGKPVVSRFIDLSNIDKYEKALGERYVFWNIVFLRMAVPVDILSYAIGIFTSVRLSKYSLATVIGITPFAFILPYASEVSFIFQIFIGAVIAVVIYLGYLKIKSTSPSL